MTLRVNRCINYAKLVWDENSASPLGRPKAKSDPLCKFHSFLLGFKFHNSQVKWTKVANQFGKSSYTGQVYPCMPHPPSHILKCLSTGAFCKAYLHWNTLCPKHSLSAMQFLVFLWLCIKSTCISSFTKIKQYIEN